MTTSENTPANPTTEVAAISAYTREDALRDVQAVADYEEVYNCGDGCCTDFTYPLEDEAVRLRAYIESTEERYQQEATCPTHRCPKCRCRYRELPRPLSVLDTSSAQWRDCDCECHATLTNHLNERPVVDEAVEKALVQARNVSRYLRASHIDDIADELDESIATLSTLRTEKKRIEVERDDLNIIADLTNAVRWWAAQEDGIPSEIWGIFGRAMLRLGWSYSTKQDLETIATQDNGGDPS